MITTCYGDRNRKCAEAFARERLVDDDDGGKNDNNNHDGSNTLAAEDCQHRWARLEQELLHGQKLQGTFTAKDVYSSLTSRGEYVHRFPLMKTIYEIAFEGRPVSDIIDGIRVSKSVEDSI